MGNDERDRPIRIYLNRSRTDKIPKDATQDEWREFHRQWAPYETTARGMAVEIYRGHSIAHLHDGRKTRQYWQEAWYVALDFDTGDERSSLDYLAQQDLINWFASFAYTTPSHADDEPRARVVWVFDAPITDYEEYETLYKAMLAEFPWADQSTKDAARFFYGSKGCTVWSNWSIFPRPSWQHIRNRYLESMPVAEPVRTIQIGNGGGDYTKYVVSAVQSECSRIIVAGDGEKHNTRYTAAACLGELVAADWAPLSYQDAYDSLLDAAMRNTTLSRDTIEMTIRDGLEKGMAEPRALPVREYQLENVL